MLTDTAEIHVSQADLDFLSDPSPDSESHYHGVYPEKSGWVPRAFRRRLSPPQETPRQAAEVLARWWKRKYGRRWRAVWAYRQTQGWSVLKAHGGVWAVAEICGRAAVLVGRDAAGHACEVARSPGCRPFRSRADAAAGVREWAAGQFGPTAPLVVRRTWAPQRNRMTPVPRGAA